MLRVVEGIREKHADTIIEFQIKLASESEGLELNRAIVEKGVLAVFEDSSKGQYYVAEMDGHPVASLLIVTEWSDWRNRDVWWIHSVYVASDFRRQGVFKKMYQFLKEKVEASNEIGGLRLYVDKTNSSAIKTYQNLNMSDDHYLLFEWLK